MRKSWATSSLDLHLDVPGTRVRAGLEAALRDAVRTGRLAAGTGLPSSRALAADLGIARNTVAEAYGQLVAEGWLTARQGSGTRVAGPPDGSGLPADSGARSRTGPAAGPGTGLEASPPLHGSAAATAPPSAEAGSAGSADEPSRTGHGRPRYELRAGLPELSSFPRSAWLAASRRALNAAPARALGYGDPRGRPELRRALAEYLARARGVRVSPDRIVICTGFTQGLDLLGQVLASRGAAIMGLEAYGLPGSLATLAAHGLAPLLLPVDDGGAVLDGAASAQALLLTPAHQFPLGPALAANRRAQAAQWAASTGGLVIEDDYDGEFRYDRQPVGALQALAPDQVVYAGTASKTLAPGLRLGWLVLPDRLVGDVATAKAQADAHTGSFEQLAFAEFISSGGYDRHIRRSRLGYRRRRDRLVAELARHSPAVRLTGIAAGLHAVAKLPDGQSERDVTARAARRGLWVEGLGNYARGEHTREPALVIGYAAPPEHAFTAALARLCATLADLDSSGDLGSGRVGLDGNQERRQDRKAGPEDF